jgi:hypothetical protein
MEIAVGVSRRVHLFRVVRYYGAPKRLILGWWCVTAARWGGRVVGRWRFVLVCAGKLKKMCQDGVIDDIFSLGRLSTGAVEEVEWAASAGCNADGAGKIAC